MKKKNANFDGSVSFEQIVELYLFNANFRQLLFTMIERIEINLRCRVANHFSHTYGVLGYEEPSNFNDPDYHKEFLDDIDDEIDRNSKAPFVKNFRNNYADGKIPFYALVELFSFGTLSKFYKNMKPQDKKAVAQLFGIGYTYLESWVEHIAFVRNICAHYGRLYNVNLAKTPKLYKQYTSPIFKLCKCRKTSQPPCHYIIKNVAVKVKMHVEDNLDSDIFYDFWQLSGCAVVLCRNVGHISKITTQYTEQGISSIRVYAPLLCIKHLIPNDRHWTEFVDTIDLLFEKYPHADKKLMGFPDDWADVLRS